MDDDDVAMDVLLGAAAVAAAGQEADDDSDEVGMAALLKHARVAREERFVRRSGLLCKHMRAVKRARGRADAVQVAHHVAAKIAKHNSAHAIRREDIIDVHERRPRRLRGSGKWRAWLPSAILRACWGKQHGLRFSRMRWKQPGRRTVAPSAGSSAMLAQSFEAAGGYIQQVRDAVAEHFMQLQKEGLQNLRRSDIQFIEIAMDETELPTNVDFPAEAVHHMVVHVIITRHRRREPMTIELTLPPALLESTSAEHLFAALVVRLPFTLHQLVGTSQKTVIFLNTDSAPSCLRLGRHLGTICPTLPSPCKMHQFAIALVSTVSSAGLTSAVFCGSLLLHRKRVVTRVRRELRKCLGEHFKLRFTPASQEQQKEVHDIMDLLKDLVVDSVQEPSARSKRFAAWKRLRVFLVGPISAGELWHYCPLGCHSSRQQAIDQLFDDLDEMFLKHPPVVPAWNKWGKILPPVMWFMGFVSLSALLPDCMRRVCDAVDEEALEPHLAADGDDALLIGMDDAKAFKCQEQARFKKPASGSTAPSPEIS